MAQYYIPLVGTPQIGDSGGGGGGGGGALVVTVTYDEQTDTEIMDKTWAEIFAALSAGQPASVVNAGEGYAVSYPLVCAYQDPHTSEYAVYYLGNEIPASMDISNMYFAKFTTSSADGYPHTGSVD